MIARVEGLEARRMLSLTAFEIRGDYAAAGVGLRGQTSGNINISGIPQGASVEKAYLYWGYLDNGEDASLKTLTFSGVPVTGTLTGSGPDTCWQRSNSYAYRADVTAEVTGNEAYSITGVATGGSILAEGASLAVVYKSDSSPAKVIDIWDGDSVVNQGGHSTSVSLNGFTAVAPAGTQTTFIVGDGQASTPDNITNRSSFAGSGGVINWNNNFSGSDGQYWDTKTYDVSSVMAAGDTSASASIGNGNDCLMWVAQVMSVTAIQQPQLSVSSSIDSGGLVTADDPTATFAASIVIGTDDQGNPVYADDGATIQWRVQGPGGSLDQVQTTTTSGFSINTLHTTTQSGDTFDVIASILTLNQNGQSFTVNGPDVTADPIRVVPGQAASITFSIDQTQLPADANSQATITLTARDAAGNLVSDGSGGRLADLRQRAPAGG
jgi:hypothetical protein